jgi:ribonuclease HI
LESVALVMVAEAEACRRGLQLPKDMGVRRIVVETDSKLVADMWQSISTKVSDKVNFVWH